MKNIIYSFAFLLTSFFTFANDFNSPSPKSNFTSAFENESTIVTIKYKIRDTSFETKKRVTNNDLIISKYIDSELIKIKNKINSNYVEGDICSVTVSVGYGSTYISATITGDCKGIAERAAKLKKELTAAIR
jgi:hypothetical protein